MNKAGTMPDSTPFWCGPSYPAHPPCFYYHGTPGSATFERLDADVELTADSTSAGYGSNVKFVLQAVPAYVEGQPMAISIDSTAWIADEDSLGGDWNDASLSGACTWDNLNNWVTRQCTRAIRSSGTLRVRGGINGKYFEKTWHISRTDAYPIVTAKRYFVSAGQRDTFTVRMSDGSAFTMSRWYWVADSGTAQSQIVCALYANPCNGSIINESGNMRARVTHNGVFKYSQAHVTVGSPPRLQLTADKQAILFGEMVNFSTSAGAAPYSITGWTYHKASATVCGTNKTCAFRPGYSGRMRVFGLVDGRPDSASVDISVSLGAGGTGVAGSLIDSTQLDSASAASLTVIASEGVTAQPTAGIHVYPKDSTVQYAFAQQNGFAGLVAIRDDTAASSTGSVIMSRSHTLEAAVDPDWVADPLIADLVQRLQNLLSTSNKPAAYADLLTRQFALARTAGPDAADQAYAIAQYLAFDPYRCRPANSG